MQREHFENENYEQETIPVNMGFVQLFSIIIFIVYGWVFLLLFNLIGDISFWSSLRVEQDTIFGANVFINMSFLFILIPILLFLAHELIHGIFGALYSENGFKSIKFGVMGLKGMFSPYCHCREVVKVWQFYMIALMPTIILGIIPSIIALIFGWSHLLLISILMTAAGAGDIFYAIKMLKYNKDDYLYELPNDQNLLGLIIYKQKHNY